MRRPLQLLEPFRFQDFGTLFHHTQPSARSGCDYWRLLVCEYVPTALQPRRFPERDALQNQANSDPIKINEIVKTGSPGFI